MKVHTREVPLANLLAFFFKPNEKHDLGTLFIEALLKTPCYEFSGNNGSQPLKDIDSERPFCLNDINPGEIKVEVEKPTTEGNKIDILILAEEFVICIEFKINHELENPLESYSNFVKASYPGKRYFFVVLTPYKKEPIGNARNYFDEQIEFKQVILSHFFREVRKNLPKEFMEEEKKGKFHGYYKELEQTILNRKIRSERNKILLLLKSHFAEKYRCTCHNNISGGFLEINDKTCHFKIRIKSTGWYFEKWTKNNEFEKILIELDHETTFKAVVHTLQNILGKPIVMENLH